MKKVLQLTIALLALPLLAISQGPVIGTPAWVQAQQASNAQQRAQGPIYTPQNGNDTLTTIYNNTACGLNYTMASERLGQRFTPVGVPQPAGITVNLPPCAVIDKAYLYTEALGVATGITANLTNPANVSTSYSMTNIGSSVDVCWGYNGTHIWRADVTASITSGGTYTLSGLPTSMSNTGVDVEGATLMVIYTDPYASYTGTLVIDDGCHTVTGGNLSHTMTGFTACANSTAGSAFMLVGDMQMSGYSLSMNGNAVTQPQWNWWNEISASTSVTSGQTSCSYMIGSSGDCYTLGVAGLYFQTGCSTCTPATSSLTLTMSSVAASCNGNGTASVAVTGGTGNYTYLWVPGGQTTSTATNLAPGTYSVQVNDGVSCASGTVTVGYTGMVLSTTTTPVTCASQGSATVSVSGGIGPFSYSWAPSGGTAATATGLAAGVYTVTVTDNGSGCVMTAVDSVINNSNLVVNPTSLPDSCPSPSGAVFANASGGQSPYSYLWSPGGQTTASVSPVAAGTYSVTVTDAAGCVVSNTVTVTTAPFSGWAYTGGAGMIGCGDSLQLNVWTNLQNATYSWSPATFLDNPSSQSPWCTATTNITYMVTVTSACGTASDSFTVYIDSTNQNVEQICFVTVDTATNKNIVVWERWNSPSSGSYNIYKETAVTGVYALCGTQPVSQFTTFIDMASNPQVMANRYIITTVDSCGGESDTSYHHRTIHLQTSPNGNGGWNLQWTAYEGLPIVTYNIFRGPSMSQLTLLTQVAGSVFTYTDLTPPAGTQYYLIEAVHPFGGCSPSLRLAGPSQNTFSYSSSISNLSTAQPDGLGDQEQLENTLLLMPNPGSGTFQLSMSLGSAQQISISVYDNLGRIVHTQAENATAGSFTTSMNLASLSAGVYSVQVNTESGSVTRRLVVE